MCLLAVAMVCEAAVCVCGAKEAMCNARACEKAGEHNRVCGFGATLSMPLRGAAGLALAPIHLCRCPAALERAPLPRRDGR